MSTAENIGKLNEANLALTKSLEYWRETLIENQRLREALHSIIRLDHHNHGPESQATTLARAALATGEQK